jgi:hypothetical protein
MKKWIPVLGLAIFAIACSKDDDAEMVYNQPEPVVMDTSNDILQSDEIINSLD